MFDRVEDGEYAGQGSVWTVFYPRTSCVRQIEEEKALCPNPMESCSTPLPFQDGASIRSSGMPCYSPEMITNDLWIFGRVDTLFFRNRSCGWSPLISNVFEANMQSFNGVLPGGSTLRGWFQVVAISYRRCLNHRIVVRGTLKRLAPSAVPKLVCSILTILSLSTMMRPLQVTLCWNEVFLQCPA